MKKILPLLMIAIAGMLALNACSGDEPQGIPSKEQLDVNPDKVIDANSITDTIAVKANCRWTVELLKGWDDLVLNTHEGNGNEAIRLDMQKNTQTTTREGVLRVVSNTGVIIKTVNVKQRGIDPFIELNKNTIDESYEGGTQTVTILSNADWEVISDGVPGFSCEPMRGSGNSSISFKIDPNLAEEGRSSLFTIQTTDKLSRVATAKVTVSQRGRTLEISISQKEEKVVPAGASYFNVTIRCSDKWRIEGGEDGFDINPKNGTGNGEVTVTIDANPYEREQKAQFTFRAYRDGLETTKDTVLNIRQSFVPLKVEPGFYKTTVDAAGGTYQIPVTCNGAWTASLSSDEWITLETPEGQNNGSVIYICKQNASTSPRSATITLKAGSDTPKTVTIEQQAGTKPTVGEPFISDVTKYEATVAFSYQSSTSTVTEYGVCYATHETPTINDSKVSKSGGDTGNDVTVRLENLESGTLYYVRPYARNATGITYGEQKTFTTKGSVPGGDDNIDPKY